MTDSMTRRRFLKQAGSVALAAGAGGTLLDACGGSSSSSGPVTLTYGWWSNGTVKDNAMKAWVQSFTKVYPNIKINPEILTWADYWNKLQTTVAGGNAYDIVGMAGSMAAPYFDQKALLDLSQFSDLSDATKNLFTSGMQMCNWKSTQYSLPVGIYVPLLGYNKSLLSKANVPFPDPTKPMDISEFMSIGAKLSIKSGGQYVQYAVNISDFDQLWTSLIQMEGGQVYDNEINPKQVTLNNTPAGVKGLTDWQNLYTQNIAVPFAQQGNGAFGAGDIDSLQTNKVAFSRIVLADFLAIQQGKLTDQIGVTPLFSINGKQVTSGNANSFGIFAGTKHPNEAWQFLKWATSAGQKVFAQVSDMPADKDAFDSMGSYLQPSNYTQTLIAARQGFIPDVMTPSQQWSTDSGDILTDLSTGKLTPAAAAQQLTQKGNADLGAVS